MKYAVIIAAGAADFPLDSIQGKTALQCAEVPETSQIAAQGVVGQVQTVAGGGSGLNSSRSDLAFASLFGLAAAAELPSRGVLQAIGQNISLEPNQTVVGCNFVTLSDGKLSDPTAGGMTEQEAKELLDSANQEIGNDDLKLVHVRGSRSLLIASKALASEIRLSDPNEVVGRCLLDLYPRGAQSEVLCQIMDDSVDWFANHPVNQRRADSGKPPVTCLWFSDIGQAKSIASFQDQTGKSASLISTDSAALGLAKGQSIQRVSVPVSENMETELAAVGKAATQAIADSDIVFVFSDSADQASLRKDVQAKIEAIQQLDRLVVKPLVDALKQHAEWRILICPDKIRSAADCRSSDTPVCFAAAGTGIAADDFQDLAEPTAEQSGLNFKTGADLLGWFLGY